MANERLFQFPTKAFPVPADIIYCGDSANNFNEVQVTIAGIVSAYASLAGIASLTLGNNTFPYVNGSGIYTAGVITPLAVSLLDDTTTTAMQTTLALVIGTNVQAFSAALTSIAGLTTAANQLIYTTASNTYAVITAAANSVLATDGSNVPALTQTLPTAVQSNITQLGVQAQAMDMGGFKITNMATPTVASDAATKGYADSIAGGFIPVAGVQAGSTVTLTATYNNGASGVGATLTNAGTQVAFAIDGYTASLNDRILIKNQSSTFQNGVYSVTTVGSGATNWVLTRTTDYDTPAKIAPGTLVSVANGTTNAGSSWYETATVVTVGTDPVLFSVFFEPQNYLSSALASGTFYLGDASNVAQPVAMSGDATMTNAGVVTVTKTNNVAFTSYATAAVGQLAATATNDNATAGNIGEFVSSTVLFASAISMTTAIPTNITSISLTAGDWDVWGNIGISHTGTVAASNMWISSVSATVPDSAFHSGLTGNVSGIILPVQQLRFSLTTTTTIYLSASTSFSTGTAVGFGGIYARRAR